MTLSTSSMHAQLRDHLSSLQDAMARQQLRISTGRQAVRRSEDPAAGGQAADIVRARRADAQWADNAEFGLSWSQVTEDRMAELVDRLQRVQELAVQGSDATFGPADRGRVAAELDALIESLVDLGNTRHQDAYLFGGVQADQPPLAAARDGQGRITAVAMADPALEPRSIRINPDAAVAYGQVASGPRGVFADAAAGIDVLQSVIALRDQLEAGGPPPAGILDAVERALDHGIARLVETGVDQQRFSNALNRLETAELRHIERLGDVRDVDLAEALTELSRLEASLQASLEMASRMNQLNLADYL